MKNIFNTFTGMTWKGKAIAIGFLFSACMNDENLVPSNHRDAFSDGVSTQSTRQTLQSARAQQNFTAHLSGDQEVPAVDSKGTGQAIFKLNEDGTALYYKLIVANIEDVTQAHIHCGSSIVSGPVVAFLFGFNAEGVNVNGVLAEGTITNSDIIVRPDTEACVGGLATFENLLDKMRSGDVYVNVHTIDNPAGEIRGQIK